MKHTHCLHFPDLLDNLISDAHPDSSESEIRTLGFRRFRSLVMGVLCLVLLFANDTDAAPYNASMVEMLPVDEYSALVALYNSAGGNQWTVKTNWLNPNATYWNRVGVRGVTYDSNGNVLQRGHVFSLDLDDNQLSGSLPEAIGNLTSLEELYLGNNQLSGSIPATIGRLTKLKYLSLQHNQLSGSIPAEIGSLTNLVELSFTDNQLSGSIPAEMLGSLSKLVNLSFEKNQLSGSIPAIGSLTRLRFLSLSFNHLSGSIPATIGNLTRLENLNLTSNQLSGDLPAGLLMIDPLDSVSLKYNYFNLDSNSPYMQTVVALQAKGVFVTYEPQKDVQITMHRVEADAVTNIDAGISDIDAPIEPKAHPASLLNQPQINGGLVADGVTPLLVKLTAYGVTTAVNYSVSLEVVPDTGGSVIGGIASHFRVLADGQWAAADVAGSAILTIPAPAPGQTSSESYAYLSAFAAEEMQFENSTEIICRLTAQKKNAAGNSIGVPQTLDFKLRKPPVVLVHGYNTPGNWGPEFLAQLYKDRHPSFVYTEKYGVFNEGTITEDTDLNTRGTLPQLADHLSEELRWEVEDPNGPVGWHNDWAFTRYDVVAHSQGGVLTRMLCAKKAEGEVPTFRNASNFYRGRFHRVITIGSPHNGSRLVRYMFGILSKNNFIDLRFGAPPSWGRAVGLLKHAVSNLLFESIVPGFNGTVQPKFEPWGPQIWDLNRGTKWVPDLDAKFHFIVTGVDAGGSNLEAVTIPAYLALGITPLAGKYQAVLPLGSDGVVDTLSQSAGLPTNSPQVRVINSPRTAHSAPALVFGALDNDVDSGIVGLAVLNALTNSGQQSPIFGPFPRLLPLSWLDKADIDAASGSLTGVVDDLVWEISSPAKGPRTPLSTGTLRLQVVELPDKPRQSEVTWFAEVYGSGGVSSAGVTIMPDAGDSTTSTLTIDSGVEGDVVVFASYLSTTGHLVIGHAYKATSIAPLATLTGIELRPSSVTLTVGEATIPEVWGQYDDGVARQFYVMAADLTMIVADPTVAEVDVNQGLIGKSAGTTTVQVTCRGFAAPINITVQPAAAPIIARQPEGVIVGFGAKVVLGVTADGTGPLVYQWKKGANFLFGETEQTLTIASVSENDIGGYSVEITGPGGSVTSEGAEIAIGNAPPTVAIAASASPGAVTGLTTNLSVLGSDNDGESNLSYTWAATTVPNGVSAPSFTTNGSNGAKTTTANFSGSGTYEFIVTITDMGGATVTDSVNVTVNMKPFNAWQVQNFGANAHNPAIAGPTVNPAGDGIVNLLKYAFNVNPLEPSIGVLPTAKVSGGNLVLTYFKNDAATDLTFTVLQSTDVVTWTPASPTLTTLSDTNGTSTVQASVPKHGAPKLTLRLRVTKQ